jgi:acetyl esterase/lipase
MGKKFRRVSELNALLTANALRPQPPGSPLSVPSFFASWLTSELAVFDLAMTSGVAVSRLFRGRPRNKDDRVALMLNAASAAGLGLLIKEALDVRKVLARALIEGLGVDPAADPEAAHVATPWQLVLRPFAYKLPGVKRFADIDYVGDGDVRHLLDVYAPEEPGTGRPVLLQIHGGAWVISRKEEQGLPLMNHLASRGFVCVAPNYPLSPKARWPEHLIALKHAIAWTREHAAEYGGDPSFIAVTGGSAGGHLAAMMGLTGNVPRYQPGFEQSDTSVQACLPLYGVYDVANTMNTWPGRLRLKHFLGRMSFGGDDPDGYEDATPLLHVSSDAPPFFVIHGERDSLAPVGEARELVRLLRKANSETVVYAELPRTQHGWDVFHSIRSAAVIRSMEVFVRRMHEQHRGTNGNA